MLEIHCFSVVCGRVNGIVDDDYPVDLQLVHQAMTTVRYDAYYFTVTKNIDEINQNETYYVLKYEDDGIKMEVQ